MDKKSEYLIDKIFKKLEYNRLGKISIKKDDFIKFVTFLIKNS